MPKLKKNVLVVGMPRSGTSLCTSIFANQGYFMAEDKKSQLRVGDEFNPSGYFEAAPLIAANAEIFKLVGYNHDNTWRYDAISEDCAAQIDQVPLRDADRELVARYEKNTPWVWKDPRLCYTLTYWWKLMNPDTTVVLLLVRAEKGVYNSFLRVKWRAPSAAAKKDVFDRTKAHIKAARTAIERYSIPHFEINYCEFDNNPEALCQKINQSTGLLLTPNDLNFTASLNHDNEFGRLSTYLDIILTWLPSPLRKLIKTFTPKKMITFFFPHRN